MSESQVEALNKRTIPSLSGRIALVTGAGRGIGKAIALGLAQRGARVALLARSQRELEEVERQIEHEGGRAMTVVADVADKHAVAAAIAAIDVQFGAVDILVNNAGIIGPICPFAVTEVEDWWRTVEVNVRGPVITTRAVLPQMIERSVGAIINVVTGAAPFPYFSAYTSSKAGLVRFSESLSAEVSAHGVAVFAMGPGTVRTAMSEHSLDSVEGRQWLPWFRRVFDEGFDLPPDRPAELAAALASGKYDALSGLMLTPFDDLDEIVAALDQVKGQSLYSMRVRGLPNDASDSYAAIRNASQKALDVFVLESTFAARKEQVYAAWMDARAIAKWFLPVTGAIWLSPPTLEARVGGKLAVDVRANGEDFHLSGVFTELNPATRIVFRWTWRDDFPLAVGAGDTLVTIDLQDEGSGTRLRLRHRGFTSEAARDANERGWRRCFDGLERWLSSPG